MYTITIGPIDGFPSRLMTWSPNQQTDTLTEDSSLHNLTQGVSRMTLSEGSRQTPEVLSNEQKRVQQILLETPEENVWRMTQVWYKSQGKSVPSDEARACLAAIAEEKKGRQGALEDAAKPMSDEEIQVTAEFGTKQYWAEYWAKKKASGYVSKKDEAATKRKEKEEAKAAKEAAKAEKEAAKAAKAAKKK